MIDTLPIAIVSRLIEESPDAVLVIDEHGVIRYMNESMQALSGYAAGEAIGQSINGLLPAPEVSAHQGLMQRFLESSNPSNVLGGTREFAIRHRTGDKVAVEMKALDLGTVDTIRYFGAFLTDLRPRLRAEERNAALLAQLELQAMSDALTTLPNRRAFEIEAARMLARSKRSGAQIAIGIADIDFFKKVNDTHGHPVGDEVLRAVSEVLSQAARASDFVARIGGEEFGLLFPESTPATASAVAERMRVAVEEHLMRAAGGLELKVTISIGLATFADKLSEALSNADKALYQAKNKGRNRIELA
jgi:diguanylate cyclase (GGDEF)-like protein/PAS domain S-box-containing protein